MYQINWIKTFYRFDWDFVFSVLQKFSYGDKFIHMIKVAFIKVQSKIKITDLISDPIPLVHQGCPLSSCYTLMRRRYLPISLIKIKGIQIGDHEIKTVNFFDSPTIFPRDITCLKRIQVILKLNEDASIFKINFSKAKFYGLEHMKIELINQDK